MVLVLLVLYFLCNNKNVPIESCEIAERKEYIAVHAEEDTGVNIY